MKEVLGSLPEVITAYKNYNLLVPTATDVQLNPFYKFHVEEVPVDLGENSGDIFKVGSVKTGKQDEKGKDIWEDVFSLSKPLLNKMAMAAGIQFNPKETYGERIDRVTYRAQAQGAMRKADGTARTETDSMYIVNLTVMARIPLFLIPDILQSGCRRAAQSDQTEQSGHLWQLQNICLVTMRTVLRPRLVAYLRKTTASRVPSQSSGRKARSIVLKPHRTPRE